MEAKPEVPFGSGPASALVRAFAGGSLMVATYDAEDILRYASAAFKRAFRLGAVEDAMTFSDLILRGTRMGIGPKIDCGDAPAFIADTQQRRRGRPGQRSFTTDMVDGSWYWMNETLLDDGWVVLVGTEISPLKDREQTLTDAHRLALYEARTDVLTSLPNRRQVLDSLSVAIAALPDADATVAIVLIDLDRFKRVNDEHGYLAGDAVLCDLAKLGRQMLGPCDAIGRIGGVEIPDSDAPRSGKRCHAVCREPASGGGTPGRVQSNGTTGALHRFSWRYPRISRRPARRSICPGDRALYAAKRGGRNHVALELW
ncbi:putative diguanylate cyclase YegE (plasmid) [Burkholderia sp. AD24]|nr:putative diguanylate cyclase YegE [Burkholderia sp. AD24]